MEMVARGVEEAAKPMCYNTEDLCEDDVCYCGRQLDPTDFRITEEDLVK